MAHQLTLILFNIYSYSSPSPLPPSLPTNSSFIIGTNKLVADRDPGKRKIRTKSVNEIPIDVGVDEDDSDFEDTKMDSNDEDEDMTMPDDAASEDEIKPEQQEALNDEQDLLTVLWQWVSLTSPTPSSIPLNPFLPIFAPPLVWTL